MSEKKEYTNIPTVVVVSAGTTDGGLVVIRRGNKHGYGKLALPGGYQSFGEDWREAGAREFEEETGVALDPSNLQLSDIRTVQNGCNLIFCEYTEKLDPKFFQRKYLDAASEVLEVKIIYEPEELAFSTHTDECYMFFDGQNVPEWANFRGHMQ